MSDSKTSEGKIATLMPVLRQEFQDHPHDQVQDQPALVKKSA
jgi:cell cycle sensor histidine kinase DivJ